MIHIARNEDHAEYTIKKPVVEKTAFDDAVIHQALAILAARMRQPTETFGSPQAVRDFARLRIGALPHEVFCVAFLDVQNRLIVFDEMFRGTLTQASVYPREVVKLALQHNAASVVLAHNHPSGSVEPSRADEALTQTLRSALALIDVRVLDHVIVSASDSLSMAEQGIV